LFQGRYLPEPSAELLIPPSPFTGKSESTEFLNNGGLDSWCGVDAGVAPDVAQFSRTEGRPAGGGGWVNCEVIQVA
jgi:hypothetical protein